MIAITGASGQLGRQVIEQLLTTLPANQLVAIVRDPAKIADFAARGVQVRSADYRDTTALGQALSGVDKLLLISSSEIGQRTEQHKNIIHAAQQAGVKLIAYTSLLHASTSPLALAEEHIATEALLAESGIPFVLLRNGWYSENHLASLPAALQHGAMIGSAGQGRISSASRADYAAAAAQVLCLENQGGLVYELAGDQGWTMAELVAEINAQHGSKLVYQDLSPAQYQAALQEAGLPEGFAAVLADSDAGAAQGGLFDDSHQLSQLIGRPTTRLQQSVAQALAAINP